MKITIKFITALTLLVYIITAPANDLSEQLKSFNNKLDSEVEKLLVYYADNNEHLNALEMQQAAFIASKVDEWEIAGFYCIARPMISALVLKSTNYDNSSNNKNLNVLRKYWKQLDNRLKPLRKNKKFKELKKERIAEILPCNKVIKNRLINNISLLERSLALYEQWKPIGNKEYHHVPMFTIVKSESEINLLFNQLNEIYIKANHDFIKLLAIPRYKELKLSSYNGVDFMTKKLNEGKIKFDDLQKDPNFMKKMMVFGNNKREMEQIEIDNLLFPEIAWGSWY